MNPVARDEAIKEAKLHMSVFLDINGAHIKNALAAIFEKHGANVRTAWTNAQEIYAEVFGA